MSDVQPLVSICCIAFNHKNFLKDAIEGFIKQKTSFPFEIIIHDDASTDGTAEVIKDYEARYPDLIHPILQTENQFSKYPGSVFEHFVWPHARGKYIALCEGDDYWTDHLKLQKQVDFLESNPEYTVCVGGFTRVVTNTGESSLIIKRIKENDPGRDGYTFTVDDLKKDWITKTLTAVFRKETLIRMDFSVYRHTRDIHYFYHIVKGGRGFYFTQDFGVYRIHAGGINSMKQGRINTNAAYNCYKELYAINRDDFTRHMHHRRTLALLNFKLFHEDIDNSIQKKIRLYFEAINLSRRLEDFKLLITVFFSRNFKDRLKESKRT